MYNDSFKEAVERYYNEVLYIILSKHYLKYYVAIIIKFFDNLI